MSNFPIVPVILCGGGGTRLWPRSRKAKPKPFLRLTGETTLFEQTLERCSDPVLFGPPMIVTGAGHLPHVEAQLGKSQNAQVIVEPSARNTAAAIALAALRLPTDTVMLVCPSDHHIADVPAFQACVRAAGTLAVDGWLVSLGIEATAPETGFGYLQRGEPIGELGYRTARFVEKPDETTAKQFIASGEYAWNGGIFAFTAGTFLHELAQHRPALEAAARAAVTAGYTDQHCFHPDADHFSRIVSESVDYAVMENTAHAALVLADIGWSDIGSWDALHTALATDANGNSIRGNGDLIDCRNVLIDSDGPRVSAIGLSDVVIVVDGDEVLVTTHAGAQLVGKLNGATSQ